MYRLRNILYFIIIVCLGGACKETNDIPPFNFHCLVKIVDENGDSFLQKNTDEIDRIAVNLLDPCNAEIVNIAYLDFYDYLDIQIQDYTSDIKNGIINYIIEFQLPKEQSKKFTIKIEYQFNMNRPNMINAHCNGKEPKYIKEDVVVFELDLN